MENRQQTELSPDANKLVNLLDAGERMVAMVAPSFVVDFDYPQIVVDLRRLGFEKVVELTFGAKLVNDCYYDFLKNREKRKQQKKTEDVECSGPWISTACPTVVNLVRTRFPELKLNLLPFVSPLVATARVFKKHWPDLKRVFISPCIVKKMEAKEFPEDVDYVVTYKELKNIIEVSEERMKKPRGSMKDIFDGFYCDYTKVYPLSGCVADTMHVDQVLGEDEFVECGPVAEVTKLFEAVSKKREKIDLNGKTVDISKLKFMDVLSCPGGCIGGAGIASTASIENRRRRVLGFRDKSWRQKDPPEARGREEDVEGIDFGRRF